MLELFLGLKTWLKTVIISVLVVLLIFLLNNDWSGEYGEISVSPPSDEYDEETKAPTAEAITSEAEPAEKVIPLSVPQQKPLAEPIPVSTIEGKPELKADFYSIQVLSSKDLAGVQKTTEKLQAEGFPTEVASEEVGENGTWNRVYVGRYKTKEEAEGDLGKLKANFKGSFIKFRKH